MTNLQIAITIYIIIGVIIILIGRKYDADVMEKKIGIWGVNSLIIFLPILWIGVLWFQNWDCELNNNLNNEQND